MIVFIVFTISVYAIPLKEYNIVLDTKSDIKLDSLNVDVKDYSDYRFNFNGDYIFEIMDGDDVIDHSYFNIIDTIYYDSINPETGLIEDGGIEEIKLDSVRLFIPYYKSADKIIISNVNHTDNIKKSVLEIDISRFSQKDNIIEEANDDEPFIEENEILIVEEPLESENNNLFLYIILVIILILVIKTSHIEMVPPKKRYKSKK